MSFFVNTTRETPAKRNVIESIIIGIVLTALSYIVGYEAGWTLTTGWQLWLEMFCVFTSYSCTYLCVRERRIQYPIGAVSTLAYAWLFYEFGLKGSAVLNLWLTVQLLYGWFRWRSDSDTRPVTLVAAKWWPAYVASTGIFYLIAYYLDRAAGGQQLWTDIIIVTGSILAQWLLDNKKLENWVVWLVVDVFATYEYFNSGLSIVGFQYIFFTLNTFYGFIVWYRAYKAHKYQQNALLVTQRHQYDHPQFDANLLDVSPHQYGYFTDDDSAIDISLPTGGQPARVAV